MSAIHVAGPPGGVADEIIGGGRCVMKPFVEITAGELAAENDMRRGIGTMEGVARTAFGMELICVGPAVPSELKSSMEGAKVRSVGCTFGRDSSEAVRSM